MHKCIRWCQNTLNLRDWQVTLDLNSDPPAGCATSGRSDADIAGVYVERDALRAVLWLPLDQAKKKDMNPYQSIVHEMLHVLTLGVGEARKKDAELVSYRLEGPLFRLFCRETKHPMAAERRKE